MQQRLEYRAVLAVDIEQSAGRGNVALLRNRDVLSAVLRESLEASGIAWAECLRDDLGDGLRVTAPAGVRKAGLIHPLVQELSDRLRAHNQLAPPAMRIRVRIALHAGDVWLGPAGQIAGQPLEVLARLLDAEPVRNALKQAPESVAAALLVSRHYYDETVPHGYPGISPDTFRPVTVTAKEYAADAWLHLPGHLPAAPPAPEPEDGSPAPGPAHSKMINKASGHGAVYATQNGTQHVHITTEP